MKYKTLEKGDKLQKGDTSIGRSFFSVVINEKKKLFFGFGFGNPIQIMEYTPRIISSQYQYSYPTTARKSDVKER